MTAHAAVKPASIFADHMVLQRDQSVPVWGTADVGEVVTISFAGQTKTATADAKGHWLIKLDPMPASGEPRVMAISSCNLDVNMKGTAPFSLFKDWRLHPFCYQLN